MDVADPATAILPSGTAAVLRVLSGTEARFTVRQLARTSGVSHARAAELVNRLAPHGLILVEEQGNAKLCRFNHEHLLARPVADLVQVRARLLDLLRQTIAGWEVPARHASLFGSAARGDGGTGSDLDILVVRSSAVDADDEHWADQLSRAGRHLHLRTGNPTAWLELSEVELGRARRNREPIVGEWGRDGVHLAGEDLRRLLRTVA